MVQISSVREPFNDPDLVRPALAVIQVADAMGLLDPEDISTLDVASLRTVLKAIRRAGIGQAARLTLHTAPNPAELAEALSALYQALEESPVPDSEWKRMIPILEEEKLASLLRISVSSLRRYAAGTRRTPDNVAERLHFLALVTGNLAGAYNEIGIRRWFDRPRQRLSGRAPKDLLRGSWTPDDPGASRIRQLAQALTASPAT